VVLAAEVEAEVVVHPVVETVHELRTRVVRLVSDGIVMDSPVRVHPHHLIRVIESFHQILHRVAYLRVVMVVEVLTCHQIHEREETPSIQMPFVSTGCVSQHH